MNENVYFDEIGVVFTRLMQEAKDYVSMLKHHKIAIEETYAANVLSLDQIQELTRTCRVTTKVSKKFLESIEDRRKNINSTANQVILTGFDMDI